MRQPLLTLIITTTMFGSRVSVLAGPPQPIAKIGYHCPPHWSDVGKYCTTKNFSATAIPKSGSFCPAHWRDSGKYCVK